MAFKTVEEAKAYLQGIDSIVIPKEYTYFVNAGFFCFPEMSKTIKHKCWTQMPTDGFTVRGELSCWSRKDLAEDFLMGRIKGHVHYAPPTDDVKLFQVRVVFPQDELTEPEINKLGLSKEDYKRMAYRYYQYNFGRRHPKMFSGDEVEMFAASTFDEITGLKEDILYGVRKQDLITYANLVQEELSKNKDIPLGNNPDSLSGVNRAWNHQAIRLRKSPNMDRYKKRYRVNGIKELNGVYSQFEIDYIKQLARINYNFGSVFGSDLGSFDDAFNQGVVMGNSNKRRPYIKKATIVEVLKRNIAQKQKVLDDQSEKLKTIAKKLRQDVQTAYEEGFKYSQDDELNYENEMTM